MGKAEKNISSITEIYCTVPGSTHTSVNILQFQKLLFHVTGFDIETIRELVKKLAGDQKSLLIRGKLLNICNLTESKLINE